MAEGGRQGHISFARTLPEHRGNNFSPFRKSQSVSGIFLLDQAHLFVLHESVRVLSYEVARGQHIVSYTGMLIPFSARHCQKRRNYFSRGASRVLCVYWMQQASPGHRARFSLKTQPPHPVLQVMDIAGNEETQFSTKQPKGTVSLSGT